MTLLNPDTIEGIDVESDVVCEAGTGCDRKATWRFSRRPCAPHHTMLCQEHYEVLIGEFTRVPLMPFRCDRHKDSGYVVARDWGDFTRL